MLVRKVPNPLQFYSFIFNVPGLLVGPVSYFPHYIEFIEGTNFMHSVKNDKGEEVMVYKEPSSVVAVTTKLLITVLSAIVLTTIVPRYPIWGNVDDDHVNNRSLLYKVGYLLLSIEVAKSKYFVAWVWGDAINNAAGIGFNGYDKHGKPKWDGVTNIRLWNFQEAALQKEVDSTLFEVRKKKQDADKTLEMLRALRKLRNVRKETAAQKGTYTTIESDREFEDGVSRLETMTNKARSTYREEEQTLLVMLEEEQEENKERQIEIMRQRQRESALKAVQKRKEILFGKDDPVGPDEPMFPFEQFYSQAESNLPSLMEIRRHWDSFLVYPDDPNGSGIPTDWVIPSEPASKEWASTLHDT